MLNSYSRLSRESFEKISADMKKVIEICETKLTRDTSIKKIMCNSIEPFVDLCLRTTNDNAYQIQIPVVNLSGCLDPYKDLLSASKAVDTYEEM